MSTLPTTPSPQAPAVVASTGVLNREWFTFLQALLAALVAQEARISALEQK
jgi:hypothetical protein